MGVIALTAMSASLSAGSLDAILQPRTVQGFARYAASLAARIDQELRADAPFLEIDRQPVVQRARSLAALHRSEVIVSQAVARDGATSEIEIDGGMINHWRGTALIPKLPLDVLMRTLHEPQPGAHKQEDVLSTRVVRTGEGSQKLYLRLRRTKFVTVVYDTEYDTNYRRLTPDRAVSQTLSTRIVEIEHAGTSQERALPEGRDRGYVWRLYSYWRFQQSGDDVIIQVESLTLSRKLPTLIGPLIRPLINKTARESMTRTLNSMRARFASRPLTADH